MDHREFKPTNWALRNPVSVWLFVVFLSLFGIYTYTILPKEQFPDIVIPTVYVGTLYPGTSPNDIETSVTRVIEKELKSLSGVKKITSQSQQDFSSITVEFLTDIQPAVAKQRVADAVDKAKGKLPNDLPGDPIVVEVDFSEFPVMSVNLSGDFTPDQLKRYGEELQDRIEALREVTRADLIGAPERELQINLDLYKMQAAGVDFGDVRSAVVNENLNVYAGELEVQQMERALRIVGQVRSADEIANLVVRTARGTAVSLRDIATVRDTYADAVSYARLGGKPVISLSVVKKSGENLVNASDKIREIIDEMKKSRFPKGLDITITNDQSEQTRTNLNDLNNSVYIGFILVVIVLMFFMGVRNAVLVGLAIPLSAAIAFAIMPSLGFTFNLIVTFSFLLALGIIVDNAIVVVENTYRLYTQEGYTPEDAAKYGAGEVFAPVLSGTLTTIAPFFPLLFWPGIVGEFMYYLPMVLIITLSASMFIAFIVNPVFAMKYLKPGIPSKNGFRNAIIVSGVVLAVLYGLSQILSLEAFSEFTDAVNAGLGTKNASKMIFGIANFAALMVLFGILNKTFITPVIINNFQNKFVPALIGVYESTLRWVLRGKRPVAIVGATVALLVFTYVLLGSVGLKSVFFPDSDPNYTYVYLKMPPGTRIEVTDSLTQEIEKRVYAAIKGNEKIVTSVISNVGIAAGDPTMPDKTATPNKGKVTVAYVGYAKRDGASTTELMKKIREAMPKIPDAEITVDKEKGGPPTGKPISIEIAGDDFATLMDLELKVKKLLVDSLKVAGIEELKSDLDRNKPEIIFEVDREKAQREGVSSGQIGMLMRTALFGDSVSTFRDIDDDYRIKVRLDKSQRNDLGSLMNMSLSFRDMSSGQFRQLPVSAFVKMSYSNTFSGITRKNLKRVITLGSNVLTDFNPNEVNEEIRVALAGLELPPGYSISQTGEQEDQKETAEFLAFAFVLALALIFFIMATQFNSMIKAAIIFVTIIFSTIGVFLGYIIFNMDVSIVMTGVGIVALAGIVVNNGIVLIDFIEEQKLRGARMNPSLIAAGSIRVTPVLLTAITTLLGLVPLAVGFNIDFVSMFTEFDPKITIGGDSVAFWGPLSWAIIFGLGASTVLTLIVVPSMYKMWYVWHIRRQRRLWRRDWLRLRGLA